MKTNNSYEKELFKQELRQTLKEFVFWIIMISTLLFFIKIIF